MVKWPCGDDGSYTFKSSLLDPHWCRNDHWPYLIYLGDELAGFCLVRRYPYAPERYDIDQFFILRKFKGMGVGRDAFRLAVSSRPGSWQVRVLLENIPALKFWRSVIGDLTLGNFKEGILPDNDLDMVFLTFEAAQ